MQDTTHSGRGRMLALCIGLMLGPMGAQAQTIYRIVGADGKVTFSDKPPVSAANATPLEGVSQPATRNNPTLPFALRQAVGKYPVTLYTGSNCTPCETGRSFLSSRGIPFTEKLVQTPDDAQALQRISGDTSLPLVTVGGQQIKGFSDAEWGQFLTAAGYPKTSALPGNYRNPPASPLVQVQQPAPAVSTEAAPADKKPSVPAPAPVDPRSNPAGIRF